MVDNGGKWFVFDPFYHNRLYVKIKILAGDDLC